MDGYGGRLLSKLAENDWKCGMGEARISWLAGQTHLDSVMIATGGSDRQTMACRAHLYARN